MVLAGTPWAHCRRWLRKDGRTTAVALKQGSEGWAFGGLFTCGSPWTCAICSMKIRRRRVDEARAVLSGVLADGGSAILVTFTLPHERFHRCKQSLDVLSKGFTKVLKGRAWEGDDKKTRLRKVEKGKPHTIKMGMAEAFGYLGVVKALEVTHGDEHGHHPHYHVVFCFSRPLSNVDNQRFMEWVEHRYCDAIENQGYKRPSAERGVDFEPITSADNISAYLTKVEKTEQLAADQELTKVGWEVAGGPAKRGRGQNLSSWQLLEWFADTGEMSAADAFVDFAKATKGRPALYISPKLRELYVTEPEKTDEELAAEEDAEGHTVAELDVELWAVLCRIRGARLGVLEAAEDGGLEGVQDYFERLHIPVERLPGYGGPAPDRFQLVRPPLRDL